MAIPIPSPLVESILLGPVQDRRLLQDSPILGDVLVAFGKQPGERLDLLISPFRFQHAGSVADAINSKFGSDDDLADVAFLQGLVVAKLTFEEVMRVVVPITDWWDQKWNEDEDLTTHKVMKYTTPKNVKESLGQILPSAKAAPSMAPSEQRLPEAFDRIWALAGLFLWAEEAPALESMPKDTDPNSFIRDQAFADVEKIAEQLAKLAEQMMMNSTSRVPPFPTKFLTEPVIPLVFQVSLNRAATPALSKSVAAVKADAAKTLFNVNCSVIGWAVIDSGIDGGHPAFRDEDGKSRVKRSFDFKNLRTIMSLRNARPAIALKNFNDLMKQQEWMVHPPSQEEGVEALQRLAADAKNRGPVHWELVEKFIEIKPDIEATRPLTNHGTHVAGIIGASKQAAEEVERQAVAEKAARKAAQKAAAEEAARVTTEGDQATAVEKVLEEVAQKVPYKENPDFADGMCPDIKLYDFRVLGTDIIDTEFQIIAALQFIRYLNGRDNFFIIHGANMSLSLPHDVRNWACGHTPICEEAERLVASGVVVVAAAGNQGFQSFETKVGSFESYAAFSITDPGNADNVLTVGATHRFWPHTYGVSFFSSRGPTGDGRLKPDLVAPGERIKATLPKGEWGDLDGTSMAAPHVSGAAAMLMARYSELVGQPLRIKRILCESATDLARERSFQGHGMLDVLRAFQSI